MGGWVSRRRKQAPSGQKSRRKTKKLYETDGGAALIVEAQPEVPIHANMVSSPMNRVLRILRRAALHFNANGGTDRQLLERFLASHEEAAFEALVRRHGPMVLGVCRRVLEHQQDAEDAYQATFLVLASKASSILDRESVANWLYGVAYRTAQKARVAAARRRVKENHMARPEAFDETGWDDLRPLLDKELNCLPDKYREPLILCDLEGVTRKEAAQQLGWSEGTLSGRLARARGILAKRLGRYGLPFAGAGIAAMLSSNEASACVPASLVLSTVKAAASVAAGHAVTGVVSAPVAALTKGVLKTMFLTKLKTVSAVLLAVGILAVGGASYFAQPAATPAQPAQPAQPKADADKDQPEARLPTGMPPLQALVSMNPDGKLTVKSRGLSIGNGIPRGRPGGGGGDIKPPVADDKAPPPGAGGPGGGGGIKPGVADDKALPPGVGGPAGGGGINRPVADDKALPPGGGGGAPGVRGAGGGAGGVAPPLAGPRFGRGVANNDAVVTQTYELKDVQVFDTKGKRIDNKDVAALIKEETVAMATWGQGVDPLHLRLLKDGTLTFVLPLPQGFAPGAPPGGVRPVPAPPAQEILPPAVKE
jgi:RNA polymerase sigma factor (sigma-70 family)